MTIEHTPGELKAEAHNLTIGGQYIAKTEFVNQSANARRMVACWNACDGIQTEKLEKAAGDHSPVFALLMETAAERDELLKALKQAHEALRGSAGPDEMSNALRDSGELIAKIGGAA